MKPVCVKCEIEFRPERNGIYVKELRLDGSFYKLWAADKWKCPKCGTEITYGYGSAPIVGDWEKDAPKLLEQLEKETETVICHEK